VTDETASSITAAAEDVSAPPSGNQALDDARYWHSIDWVDAERNVRRLRQRIFKATQDGDLTKVRNLQKLMLRSRSNTLVSVRRVTQRSLGRRTPGVDGELALDPAARGRLARTLAEQPWPTAKPVRRVHIPKANGKMRPLGIPVIRDRAQQARVKTPWNRSGRRGSRAEATASVPDVAVTTRSPRSSTSRRVRRPGDAGPWTRT